MIHNLRTTRRGRGFTLIELLVTVGVIVILIAILLPVLSAARAQANTTRCLANQRQLLQAMISFSVDNDGYLPSPNFDAGGTNGVTPKGWLYDPMLLTPQKSGVYQQTDVQNGAIYPYVNSLQVYRCYADLGTYPPTTVQIITSYTMNAAVCDYGHADLPEKLRAFKSNAILLWEIPSYAALAAGEVNDGANWPPEGMTTRHQHGSTIGFADGHAEQMTWTAFTNEWFYHAPGMLWCAPKSTAAVYDGGKITCPSNLLPSSPPPEPASAD